MGLGPSWSSLNTPLKHSAPWMITALHTSFCGTNTTIAWHRHKVMAMTPRLGGVTATVHLVDVERYQFGYKHTIGCMGGRPSRQMECTIKALGIDFYLTYILMLPSPWFLTEVSLLIWVLMFMLSNKKTSLPSANCTSLKTQGN